MLSDPVPSATSDTAPGLSPIEGGAAEEPEPPALAFTADLNSKADLAGGRRHGAFACAMACTPVLPLLGVADLPVHDLAANGPALAAQLGEGSKPFVISIEPMYAFLSLAAAAIGSYGAIAAASLIGYSPTRLGQLLDEQRRPDKDQLTEEFGARDREYFLVAIIYAAAGWVWGMLMLREAIDANNYPWALAIWVALMLFGAGSLPGAMADARAERSVLRVLPLLRIGWTALRWPLVLPLQGTTRLAMRALRLQRPETDDPAEVQKQVMAAVADNVNETELADAERTWIGNIVTLKDQDVATVMTPRPDITALPETISLHEAVDQALEHEFSRYPVYRERIDEVVGIFYVKDALRFMQQSPQKLTETPLQTLLRDPLFVPETTGAAELLRRMQAGNQHMAIVIDEYGTTVGLATVEDLIEEIVGEIEDEYDPPISEQSEDQIRIIEAGRVLEIPARTSIQDVNKVLGSQLSDAGDYETVAGLVIDTCNRIPTTGETVVVDDVEFRVLEANERRVQRLRVTLLEPQPATDGPR